MAMQQHETVVNYVPKLGVIGDRRHIVAKDSNEKKKKHVVKVDGVPFEVDVKYKPVSILGKGSFGHVISCFNHETKRHVAVKKIESGVNPVMTLREIQILRQLRHPNVISLDDVMLTTKPGSNPSSDVYLVQQQMLCDLANVIDSSGIPSQQHCKHIMFKILRGVRFLHSAHVIHRDLKPSNILVGPPGLDVKIADFGHARTWYEDSLSMSCNVGTRWYKAPELVIGLDDYGAPVDMWSVGCIFAEMLCGRPILMGNNNFEMIKMILNLLGNKVDVGFVKSSEIRERLEEYLVCLSSSGSNVRRMFQGADPLAVDLLERMLEFSPWKRISAKEALKHDYFSGMYDQYEAEEVPQGLRLEVDDNGGQLTEKRVWELIREEMFFYHPQQRPL